MTNAMTTFRPHLPHVRPGMLGRNVFDDVFDSFFNQDTVSSLLRNETKKRTTMPSPHVRRRRTTRLLPFACSSS